MSLKDKLVTEMKDAMKAGDQLRLGVIRLLRSRIKNVEIDQGELDDAGVQKIVQQQIKQWKDALLDYKKGDRPDLVEEAQQKIKILESYLPKQLSDEKLKAKIQQIQEETGLEAGPLIGKVKQVVGNQAEGSRIVQLVNQLK